MRLGWLDDTLNEDDAEKCVLTVPIETGRNTMVTVSLASSFGFWVPGSVLEEVPELAPTIHQGPSTHH